MFESRVLRRSILLLCALMAPLAPNAHALTICSGACPILGEPPTHSGVPYDFVLAVRAEAAETLSFSTTGSIYVFGDLSSSGDITLAATNIAINANINASDLAVDTCVAGICTMIDPDLVLGGGGVIVIGGTGGIGLTASVSALAFDGDGDIYVDVADITVGSFSLTAGGDIVIDKSARVVFTPEPGSGLLLAGGLLLLGARQRKR